MKLALDQYRLLGRSGLRVSPLCLGTMTFGTEWGWGADKETSQNIFNTYADRGGNFIDTANRCEHPWCASDTLNKEKFE